MTIGGEREWDCCGNDAVPPQEGLLTPHKFVGTAVIFKKMRNISQRDAESRGYGGSVAVAVDAGFRCVPEFPLN